MGGTFSPPPDPFASLRNVLLRDLFAQDKEKQQQSQEEMQAALRLAETVALSPDADDKDLESVLPRNAPVGVADRLRTLNKVQRKKAARLKKERQDEADITTTAQGLGATLSSLREGAVDQSVMDRSLLRTLKRFGPEGAQRAMALGQQQSQIEDRTTRLQRANSDLEALSGGVGSALARGDSQLAEGLVADTRERMGVDEANRLLARGLSEEAQIRFAMDEFNRQDALKRARERADIASAPPEPLTRKEVIDIEGSNRKEFRIQSDDFVEAQSGFLSVERLARGPQNPQSQVALLTAFAKTLDPSSRVTDAEIKSGQITSLPGQLQLFAQRIRNGQILTAKMVSNIQRASADMMRAHATRQRQLEKEFRRLATGIEGANPDHFVIDRMDPRVRTLIGGDASPLGELADDVVFPLPFDLVFPPEGRNTRKLTPREKSGLQKAIAEAQNELGPDAQPDAIADLLIEKGIVEE